MFGSEILLCKSIGCYSIDGTTSKSTKKNEKEIHINVKISQNRNE